MALSNFQYDRLMRSYEQRQLDNERDQKVRYEEAVRKIPEIAQIDNQIASSVSLGPRPFFFEGAKDIGNLKEEIEALSLKRKKPWQRQDSRRIIWRNTIHVLIVRIPVILAARSVTV